MMRGIDAQTGQLGPSLDCVLVLAQKTGHLLLQRRLRIRRYSGLRPAPAPSASHNCSGVARRFRPARVAKAAGLVSPPAFAFSIRRALAIG